jgi:hypothetical protein
MANVETTTRRSVLVGATALAAAPLATAGASVNSRLLELGRQFEAAWAIERPLWDIININETVDWNEAQAAGEITETIVDQILSETATTMEELRVKARAVSWCWSGDIDMDVDTTDMKMTVSILRDLLVQT